MSQSKEFMNSITERLLSEHYEHPFKWDPRRTMNIIPSPNEVLVKITDQLSTRTVDADLQFEYLMYYVGQSYAYANGDKLKEALDSLQNGEDKLNNEFSNNSPDDTKHGQAFLHLTMSMRAFLLTLIEDTNAAADILPKIFPISEMDIENQAALDGLRGLFYGEYGFEGFKLAIEFLSKAIEKDSNESSWHFLKGKYLSRLRHVERPQDLPDAEEMYHLELAASQRKNGTYSLFLAQMYHEMAKCYFSRLRNSSGLSQDQYQKEKRKSFQLNEKSSKLYKESLDLKPDCPQMLFRCAKGFMRLPHPFRQEELAKKLIEKGLKLIPDSGFGNHTMAQYYERIEKNPQKAMNHLKICEEQKIFPAIMDLVRLEYQIGEATDTVQRLEALLNDYKEVIQKSQILVLLSSYHLFSLNNLRKACHYASEIKRLNGNYDNLKKPHPPLLVRGTAQYYSKMINLQEVLMDEIRIAVQKSACSLDDKKYFEAFFEELSSMNGESVSISLAPRSLKSQIIADATKPLTTSNSRASNTNESGEEKNRNKSVRDRGSKFRFSKAFDGRKTGSSSSKVLSHTNPKGEDDSNCGDQENHDSGNEEVVRSMRKMKTQDTDSSDVTVNRSQKSSTLDPLMMAMLDKYRD